VSFSVTFPGRLVLTHDDAIKRMQHYRCVTCDTLYPRPYSGTTTCNGVVIATCPWCGPDSAAAARARGDHLRARPQPLQPLDDETDAQRDYRERWNVWARGEEVTR